MSPTLALDDPVAVLAAEKHRLIASLRATRSDKKGNKISEKSVQIDKALIKAKPATLAGAAAGLTIAKYEFETFIGANADDGHAIILAMINGALDVLQRETAKATA
jgi:hypothetical protein